MCKNGHGHIWGVVNSCFILRFRYKMAEEMKNDVMENIQVYNMKTYVFYFFLFLHIGVPFNTDDGALISFKNSPQ